MEIKKLPTRQLKGIISKTKKMRLPRGERDSLTITKRSNFTLLFYQVLRQL